MRRPRLSQAINWAAGGLARRDETTEESSTWRRGRELARQDEFAWLCISNLLYDSIFPLRNPVTHTTKIAAFVFNTKTMNPIQRFIKGLDIRVCMAHEWLSQVINAVPDMSWGDVMRAIMRPVVSIRPVSSSDIVLDWKISMSIRNESMIAEAYQTMQLMENSHSGAVGCQLRMSKESTSCWEDHFPCSVGFVSWNFGVYPVICKSCLNSAEICNDE